MTVVLDANRSRDGKRNGGCPVPSASNLRISTKVRLRERTGLGSHSPSVRLRLAFDSLWPLALFAHRNQTGLWRAGGN